MWEQIKERLTLQSLAFVMALVLAGATTWFSGCLEFLQKAYASVGQTEVNISKIQANAETIEVIRTEAQLREDKIFTRLGEMQQQNRLQSMLFGLAIPINCCQGDTQPWVRINQLSPALRFREGAKLKLTCRDRNANTAEVIVKGTFRAENQQYLIQMNLRTTQELGAQGKREVGVMIEEIL
jgi:hypothetical protein